MLPNRFPVTFSTICWDSHVCQAVTNSSHFPAKKVTTILDGFRRSNFDVIPRTSYFSRFKWLKSALIFSVLKRQRLSCESAWIEKGIMTSAVRRGEFKPWNEPEYPFNGVYKSGLPIIWIRRQYLWCKMHKSNCTGTAPKYVRIPNLSFLWYCALWHEGSRWFSFTQLLRGSREYR